MLHHSLRSHFVPPVAAVSGLAVVLFGGWQWTGEPWDGPHLLWNLALAWVPYLASLGLVVLGRRAPGAVAAWWGLFLVWLVFFPNAPYLVTDWLYLPHFRAELWYSIGLFLTFSLAGLLLSVTSLYLVHTLLRQRMGQIETGAILALVFLLSGLGVFLGRFLRLNSWDVVTRPGTVLDELTQHLGDPAHDGKPLCFSLGFAVLLGVCYFVFLSMRQAPRSWEEGQVWGHGERG